MELLFAKSEHGAKHRMKDTEFKEFSPWAAWVHMQYCTEIQQVALAMEIHMRYIWLLSLGHWALTVTSSRRRKALELGQQSRT